MSAAVDAFHIIAKAVRCSAQHCLRFSLRYTSLPLPLCPAKQLFAFALLCNSLPSLCYTPQLMAVAKQFLTLPQQFMALLFLAIAGQHLTKLFNSIARPIQTEHCRSDANLHKTKPSPCFTKLSLRLALQSNSSPSPCRTLLHNAFAQSISSHLNLPLPLLRH